MDVAQRAVAQLSLRYNFPTPLVKGLTIQGFDSIKLSGWNLAMAARELESRVCS